MIMPWWVRAWQSPTHTGTLPNQSWAGTRIAAAPQARGLTRQDAVAAGHISAELYTHWSRHSWKRVQYVHFVKAQSVPICPSVHHSHAETHETLTHTVMLTTTPSMPQNVQDPFRWQTNIFSSPAAIPWQMMDGQPRPDSPVSSRPITHKCLSESTWCVSTPVSVFSCATSKEPSREQGEGGSGKERETVGEGRGVKKGWEKRQEGAKREGKREVGSQMPGLGSICHVR